MPAVRPSIRGSQSRARSGLVSPPRGALRNPFFVLPPDGRGWGILLMWVLRGPTVGRNTPRATGGPPIARWAPASQTAQQRMKIYAMRMLWISRFLARTGYRICLGKFEMPGTFAWKLCFEIVLGHLLTPPAPKSAPNSGTCLVTAARCRGCWNWCLDVFHAMAQLPSRPGRTIITTSDYPLQTQIRDLA